MAFIPDEAVDRMAEVSAGAWKLYCFLARCRNQKTGKCCPSVNVTMETIGTKKSQTYELRKELAKAGWAIFDGDNVTALLGFKIPENRTTDIEPKQVGPVIPIFRKAAVEVLQVSDIPENQSGKPENLSDIPETHIRKNQQREPAKEPAKGKARAPSVVPPAVAYIRHLTHRYPDKTLWPRIVSTLGDDFDGERLTSCYENWVSHGWNKMNLVWLFEWYTKGIPERENQNGRHQKPGKETPNQRNARELDELIYQSLAPSGGFEPADKPDPGDEGLAVAFRRL